MVKVYNTVVEYPCQVCNRKGKAKNAVEIVQCQICSLLLCDKCAIGSFCKNCFETIPIEKQKKYKSSINARIIFKIAYGIFFSLPFIGFIAMMVGANINNSYPSEDFGRALGLIFGLSICPGMCIFMNIAKTRFFKDKKAAIEIVNEIVENNSTRQ